jgi:hypothetical protein
LAGASDRFIAHKFSTGRAVGVVKSVQKKKSVAGQFSVKYKSETCCWTQKLKEEDYGVDKYFSLLRAIFCLFAGRATP